MLVAPLSWAAEAWVPAVIATVVAAAGLWLLPRRWHQLSRRWLVAVPAGLVVHDPVVFWDTLMLPRPQVTSVGLAELGATDAIDLTGPTPGVAVEIRLGSPATAVLAPHPGDTQRRTVAVQALLVAPTRPGAALAEASHRGYAAQTPPPST
jgi:hypothetical protein